jgi:arylsulfatase A-like enzyme
LISIDTLRADHLGCYGYERDTSPFLDELAAGGARFANATINTHGTTPSHATILSSLYQEAHGVQAGSDPPRAIPPEVALLPEILRSHGYATLGITGGGNVGREFGFARGFDEFDDRAHSVKVGVRRALRRIAHHLEAPEPRPLFVFLHTYEVHSPYAPPQAYHSLFGPTSSDFEPTSRNLLAIVNDARTALSSADLSHVVAMYDAGIRHTDDVLRSFFEELAELGFLEDAVVAVTSDHGEEFAEHGGLLHRALLYQEILTVPLIFSGRGVAPGLVDRSPVSSVDIAPTLLALANLPVPADMQGRPLLGASGERVGPERVTVAQYGPHLYAVRSGEWKLIETHDPPGLELYHLASDPGEQADVAGEQPQIVAELRRELAAWRRRHARSLTPVTADLDPEAVERLRALGYVPGD